MEIFFFLKVLWRRMWIIAPISLLAMAATYLMYKNEPKVYKSSALVATGIINVDEGAGSWVQEYKVMNDFNNLIAQMTSRELMQSLVNDLVRHDLVSSEPFRRSADIAKYLSPAEIADIVRYLEQPISNDSTQLSKNSQEATMRNHVRNIAGVLGYTDQALLQHLLIERMKDTDYIRVEVTSENPALSAFTANMLGQNFITAFTKLKNERTDNSADFYRRLAEGKKAELNAKTESLERFKLSSQVADLEQQTKSTLEQIRDLEMQKQKATEKIPSYEKTLGNLEGYMAQDQQTVSSTRSGNPRITTLRDQIQRYNDEYVASGYKKAASKQQADNLRRELEMEVKRTTMNEDVGMGATGGTVAESRRDLLSRKLDTEQQLEEARSSVRTIDTEINRLKGSVSGLVSKEATIASYEREIKILGEEYLALTEKLNAADFAAISKSHDQKLQIHEKALAPESPEPSQAPFMTLLAGIATFMMATFVLLGLVYLDNRLLSPFQLQKQTRLPLLEVWNRLSSVKDLDLDRIFHQNDNKKELETFKQLVRNTRYKISAMGDGVRTLLLCSLKPKEGKTLVAVTLAYALSLNNQKVLLLDCNFKNNGITRLPVQSVAPNSGLERILQQSDLDRVFGLKGRLFNHIGGSVDIVGCRADGNSASELLSGKNFRALLTNLQQTYDYVLLECSAMDSHTDTKELSNYADKVVAVLSANNTVAAAEQSNIDFLHRLNDKFAGVILNMTDMRNLS